MLKFVRHRMQNRPDSEHEQALTRIVIVALVLIYLFSPWYGDDSAPHLATQNRWVIGAYFLVSLGIFAAILARPGMSPVRRYIGMLGDMAAVSYLFALGGESSIPLIGIYLWVTMGNGFRYGLPYLFASTALSIVGFSGAVLVSDFLQTHGIFVVSMLIVLSVLPLYMATLLRKLKRAIEQANEANQAKSRFLANMSHELRTPLNGVIGMSSVLRDMPLADQQKDMVDTIHVSARMLLDLINNILDISKIEAGKLTHREEDLDLHSLINNTLAVLDNEARNKGLNLIAHIAPETPYALRGDPLLLKQVLTNLLANAVKFTEQGTVELLVQPLSASVDEILLRFEVADTGIGIPQELQEHIFDSFVQADTSSRRRYGGTGLGTAIAKQLVELMGGTIGLESMPNVGSTFWFELPFRLQNLEGLGEPASPGVSRVLIYTSDRLAGELQGYLGAWSVEFDVVSSLAQTMSKLMHDTQRDSRTELVLVERSALTVEPADLARSIQHEPALQGLSLVLLLEDVSPALERQYLQAGFSSLLPLPLDRRLLFNALHAAHARSADQENVVSLAQHYRDRGPNRSLRILVADDNPINQKVVQHILERAQHRVDVVDDGEKALDALTSEYIAYDLMVLDMHMPGRNGLEVFKASRFLQESARIPTIILTANATAKAVQDCEEAGVDAYLTKPVDPATLLQTVAHLAAKHMALPVRPAGTREPSSAARGGLLNLLVLDQLLELGSNGSFVRELVDGYSRDGAAALAVVEQAVNEVDYPTYRDALHALKGSSAEIGGSQMVSDCEAMEAIKPFALSHSATFDKLMTLRERFESTCRALFEFVDQRIEHADPIQPR